uniref:Uncharacterized protein LOC111121512 isoform X1 n=1 Tax=Crassostrea virginica TaxID=6565 RepID=A0A8B8CRS8_CRAVI|nr:uncharacterized protein LOC111121512 isoform X1 [Crassostrea virginica]
MYTVCTNLFKLVYILLLFLQCVGAKLLAGQCPSKGDPSIVECCLNYIDIGGECVACQAGTMGVNCSRRCPDGFYGQFCVMRCDCPPTLRCSKAFGCVCTETSCSRGSPENGKSSESNNSACQSEEGREKDKYYIAIIAQGVVIGCLVICYVPLTVHIYRHHQKRATKKPVNYIDTEVKQEHFQMESYEALHKDSHLQNSTEKDSTKAKSRMQFETYLEPTSASRGRKKLGHTKLQKHEHYLEPSTSRTQHENYLEPTMQRIQEETTSSAQNENYPEPTIPSTQNENYLEPTIPSGQNENYLDPTTPTTQSENYLDPTTPTTQSENYLDPIAQTTVNENDLESTTLTPQHENYLEPTAEIQPSTDTR